MSNSIMDDQRLGQLENWLRHADYDLTRAANEIAELRAGLAAAGRVRTAAEAVLRSGKDSYREGAMTAEVAVAVLSELREALGE